MATSIPFNLSKLEADLTNELWHESTLSNLLCSLQNDSYISSRYTAFDSADAASAQAPALTCEELNEMRNVCQKYASLPDRSSLGPVSLKVDKLGVKLNHARRLIETTRNEILSNLVSTGMLRTPPSHDLSKVESQYETESDWNSRLLENYHRQLTAIRLIRDFYKSRIENSLLTRTLPVGEPSMELKANRAFSTYQRERVGFLVHSDGSHLLLDIKKSRILDSEASKLSNSTTCVGSKTVEAVHSAFRDPTFPENDRIQIHYEPASGVKPFFVDKLHVLGGDLSAMQLANLASLSQTPSLLSSGLLWRHVSRLFEK